MRQGCSRPTIPWTSSVSPRKAVQAMDRGRFKGVDEGTYAYPQLISFASQNTTSLGVFERYLRARTYGNGSVHSYVPRCMLSNSSCRHQ